MDGDSPGRQAGVSTPARIIAGLAVLCAFVLVAVLIFGGSGNEHKYRFLFQTGGQLVPGNEVLIAGQPIGKIDSIDLTDDSQAAVDVSLDRPLTEGTTAVIRSTSLSGVANRYISLSMGPNNASQIPDGTTITGTDTTSPVDLDQLFNTFRAPERRALQKFIAGNATTYAGKARQANRSYKFLNPALSTSQRLFNEVSKDSVSLQRFLVAGAKTFGAIADRRNDLTSLITNGNTTLQAIANQNEALTRSLNAAPDTLREANTTFVNLRAALDDLDPLVQASYPATKNLAPFLRRLKTVSEDGRPVFRNLADVARLKGPNNDLAEALKLLPKASSEGSTAFPAVVRSDEQDAAGRRLHAPLLAGSVRPLREARRDDLLLRRQRPLRPRDDGRRQRLQVRRRPAAPADADLRCVPAARQPRPRPRPAVRRARLRRLPALSRAAARQPAADLSNPFLDDGNLTLSKCNPTDLPPGP